MAVILGTLFLGISVLALSYGTLATPTGNPTVIGQIAQRVFTGPLIFMYHFLPHQFAFRGDRLAFSTGIIFLAILASVLLMTFHGNTASLINLYAVGVFLSFTLSQAGMVRHWWRLRVTSRRWKRSLIINGLGALTTVVVASVIATTKFLEGAWIVVLLLPLLLLAFLSIRHHYLRVERERMATLPRALEAIRHRLIVPIDNLDQAAQRGLTYARSISPQVTAVHVRLNPGTVRSLQANWGQWRANLGERESMQLEVIEPLHHSLIYSLYYYLRSLHQRFPDETLTVILPEQVKVGACWQFFVHPGMLLLKIILFFRSEIIVTNVVWEEQKSSFSPCSQEIHHRVLVPLAEFDWASLHSLAYARSISAQVIAVHVATDLHDVGVIRSQWEHLQRQATDEEQTHLVVIESPYRSLLHPLLAYIETVRELHPEATLTVVLPEFVVDHWWEHLLHNQTAL